MRYISLDLETSGPDPLRHQVLELAVVVEDTKRLFPLDELPSFRRLLRHPELVGTAGALALNARLLAELAAHKDPAPDHCAPTEVLPQLREFLLTQGFRPDAKGRVRFVMAGKNVASYDLLFLRELPGWGSLVKSEPATLDPAVFYLNWHKDSRLPSLSICKARAQQQDTEVAHEALADALDVVQLLRPFYQFPVYQRAREGAE
jgi:oligoribonuclease